MAKTVVSYIRVSTSGQGRSDLGLEAQRKPSPGSPRTRTTTSPPNTLRLKVAREPMRRNAAPSSPKPSNMPVTQRTDRRREVRSAKPRREFHQRINDPQGTIRDGRARRRYRSVLAPPVCRARRTRAPIVGERTRIALQAAKVRGVKLGGTNAQSIANRDEAQQRAEQFRPILTELAGMSANKAAAELNKREVPPPPRAANGTRSQS